MKRDQNDICLNVDKREAYNTLVGEIRRQLTKLTKNSIQMDVRMEVEENVKVRVRELGFEDERWMELAVVLAVLNLMVLLPENQLTSKIDLREIGCEDGKWMELVLLPDLLSSSSLVFSAHSSSSLFLLPFIKCPVEYSCALRV
jgi:hypothetical protein